LPPRGVLKKLFSDIEDQLAELVLVGVLPPIHSAFIIPPWPTRYHDPSFSEHEKSITNTCSYLSMGVREHLVLGVLPSVMRRLFMTMAHNLTGEPERAKTADEANRRLREAGFPEEAISTWWMLLMDPRVKKTAHRVWESGDFVSLMSLVNKTLRNKATYRSAIETLTSEH
jgi:hypothetical protein